MFLYDSTIRLSVQEQNKKEKTKAPIINDENTLSTHSTNKVYHAVCFQGEHERAFQNRQRVINGIYRV